MTKVKITNKCKCGGNKVYFTRQARHIDEGLTLCSRCDRCDKTQMENISDIFFRNK